MVERERGDRAEDDRVRGEKSYLAQGTQNLPHLKARKKKTDKQTKKEREEEEEEKTEKRQLNKSSTARKQHTITRGAKQRSRSYLSAHANCEIFTGTLDYHRVFQLV